MTSTMEEALDDLESYCRILEALADSAFDESEATLLVTRGIRNTRDNIRREAATWAISTDSMR